MIEIVSPSNKDRPLHVGVWRKGHAQPSRRHSHRTRRSAASRSTRKAGAVWEILRPHGLRKPPRRRTVDARLLRLGRRRTRLLYRADHGRGRDLRDMPLSSLRQRYVNVPLERATYFRARPQDAGVLARHPRSKPGQVAQSEMIVIWPPEGSSPPITCLGRQRRLHFAPVRPPFRLRRR